MKIAFLLGAGVSIPAGMPSTAELTTRVFQVDNYFRHTDERFYRRGPVDLGGPPWAVDGKSLLGFLECLKKRCLDYFDEQDKHRGVNYEDIFFAASQLHEHLLEEYENPALEPFAQGLLLELSIDRVGLRELAGSACTYLNDVVATALRMQCPPVEHLQCLIEALRDDSLDQCDVVTLNHDTLIESVLTRESIDCVDGFGPLDGDVQWWIPGEFGRKPLPKLLKLHGSVDWFRYDGRLARCVNGDFDHARTRSGRMLGFPERDQLLMGTFNKIREYTKDPYFSLNSQLRNLLDTCDLVIVSGYSFGDKGVNALLANWMLTDRTSRLLVLSEDARGWIHNARGAIRNLPERLGRNRILTHPHFLSECAWPELKRAYRL